MFGFFKKEISKEKLLEILVGPAITMPALILYPCYENFKNLFDGITGDKLFK